MVQERELALNPTVVYDSHSTDASDSLCSEVQPHFAILLTPPPPEQPAPSRQAEGPGISLILSGLFMMFLIVALRFRNNMKYVVSIFRNLIETRSRQNVFDDTVRETSLVVMLNLLWCMSAGIILSSIISYFAPDIVIHEFRAAEIGRGMLGAICYTLFMLTAYWTVGSVFSDGRHAVMWVKGFLASQGLMSIVFFIIALFSVCYPDADKIVFLSAFFVFFLVKLVFIWKGYRIFFTQFSSWVLFLCYLCSLELVPLFLTYRLTLLLAGVSA